MPVKVLRILRVQCATFVCDAIKQNESEVEKYDFFFFFFGIFS